MEYILNLFSSLSLLISQWNENGILDFVGLILSTIVPIIIMIVTLKSEKKSAKQDAIDREQQYQESMKIAKQQHLEQLKTQNDINRISIMPYLICKTVEKHGNKDKVSLDFIFTNIGNGSAVELTVKYLNNNEQPMAISDTFLAMYNCSRPFDDFSSVVQPNNVCRFSVKQKLKGVALEENKDKFSFIVCFKDMKMNQYEQKFTVVFEAKEIITVNHVFVDSPICIE